MKPIISIGLDKNDYTGRIALANEIAAGLTANAAFTTPLPSVATLQSAITDVEDALTAWGQQGSRGPTSALLDLRAKNTALAQIIKSLSQYVQNTAQTAAGSDYETMAALMSTTGFKVTTARQPQGMLQAVENFRNVVTPSVNFYQVKLAWRKPLGLTSRGNVKSYNVMRSATPVLSAAVQVAATTSTSFVDSNTSGTPQTWHYWVIPVNTAGEGVVSEMITVGVFSN